MIDFLYWLITSKFSQYAIILTSSTIAFQPRETNKEPVYIQDPIDGELYLQQDAVFLVLIDPTVRITQCDVEHLIRGMDANYFILRLRLLWHFEQDYSLINFEGIALGHCRSENPFTVV